MEEKFNFYHVNVDQEEWILSYCYLKIQIMRF